MRDWLFFVCANKDEMCILLCTVSQNILKKRESIFIVYKVCIPGGYECKTIVVLLFSTTSSTEQLLLKLGQKEILNSS